MSSIKVKNLLEAQAGLRLNAETASRVLTADGSKNIKTSTVTTTELDHLSGATSNIQTQLTSSSTTLTTHTGASSGVHGVTGAVVGTTDTQSLTNKSIDADLNTISNIENVDIKAGASIDVTKLANGSVTNTEFQYLDGVTSSIQTQLDSKVQSSQLSTRILYVDPVNGSNTVVTGRGSKDLPYLTIQAAFDSVSGATTLNQWANERISFYLMGGEYTEAAIVVWFKRRSINFIGSGAKIINNFTLNYDPTNQYTGFTYTTAGLPAPWTSGLASPTLSLGCAHDMNGMESGFTTGAMMFIGRVIFTTPNYNTQSTPNYGPSYVTMNGVEARSGFQVNDSGASSNASVVLEAMNTVISGTTGTHNIGLTRAGGTASSFTVKAADSRLTADIGPVAIIGKLDACRIGKLDRNFGASVVGAIQFSNTTSTTGITNCSFTATTNNIGNETGTTNSTVKIDKASWYQLRTTSTTLTTGGGITYNIMDQDKYVRVVATEAGSTTMTTATDHLLLDPTATRSAYTVTMKATPVDGDEVIISAGAFGITSLTLTPASGQTFMTGAAATTLPANSFVRYKWIGGAVLKWTNIGSGITSFTGDVTGSGVMGAVALTIANSSVTNAKVATGIDAVKLANGTVSNTEFQYLDGVTSAIQTQIDGKWGTLGNAGTNATTNFIGTTDAQDLVLKSNSTEILRLKSDSVVASRNVLLNRHIISNQVTAPTIAVSGNAGSGATASLSNATDVAGRVSLTTGTVGLALGGQLTVTFNTPYTVAPIVSLTPSNSNAAVAEATIGIYITESTTTFTLNAVASLGITTTYTWNYSIIETQ